VEIDVAEYSRPSGDFVSEGYAVVFSRGKTKSHHSAAVWLSQRTSICLLSYGAITGRVLLTVDYGKTIEHTLIQEYQRQ